MEDEATLAEVLSVTCTQGESSVCELVRHLSACNQLLWNAALQLREDFRDKLGDLSVRRVPGICRNFRLCNDCAHNEKVAWDLLQWLLQSHRCVVAVEADYDVLKRSALVEALASATRLTRLTVYGMASDEGEVLQESVDTGLGIQLPQEDYAETAAVFEIPVRLLEKDGTVLFSLDLTALELSPPMANKLNDALRKNCTIKELAVGANIFFSNFRTSNSFVQYLEKRNPTLQTLILRGSLFVFDSAALPTLARAICRVRTLTDLTLDGDASRRKCAQLLAELLKSEYLLSLSFLLKPSRSLVHDFPPCEHSPVPSWVSALAKNGKLQKLELDVSWSFRTDCGQLLEVLPSEHGLRSLTLRGFRIDGDLTNACRTIRKRDLGGRVRIHDYIVQPNYDLTLSEYEAVKSIVLSSLPFWADSIALRNLFGAMASWVHVTSLRVHLVLFDEDVFLSLAAYTKGVTSLKEIELRIDVDVSDDEEGAIDVDDADSPTLRSISKLCDALSSNVGTAVIRLHSTIEIGDSSCGALADAALNPHHHELSVEGVKDTSVPVFLDRLLSRLGENFNLLLLDIPVCVKPNERMREAQDFVRRNRDIADRATRFLMEDRSPCCARAFEVVSEEPVLVHSARRKLSEDALEAIRRAQKFLRSVDVHTYMRLAGVVQERVVCNAREDGARQLDRLYYDAWLSVLHYLRLDDVVLP
ncbi:hypothetical protein HPB52_001605 [Rhipicephalus sanguineus]|uniref:Nlr family card domain protein n=1 Tax=Rhipicephalus sanguineus TaxID=34632 RepID=A0A9D4PHY5_RHISA|nr:hypothetical protein HPB52_001605 [Rhipicephalus sanguineus]